MSERTKSLLFWGWTFLMSMASLLLVAISIWIGVEYVIMSFVLLVSIMAIIWVGMVLFLTSSG